MTETICKIYVHIIDGAEAFAPVNARHIKENQYEILNDEMYEDLSSMELIEFFPGDIVIPGEQKFSDGKIGQVAKQLIHKADIKDRDYLDFKFRATLEEIAINKINAKKYDQEIKRVIKEHREGAFFYPSIIDTVNKLKNLI